MFTIGKGVFTTLRNIYDGVFCENREGPKTVFTFFNPFEIILMSDSSNICNVSDSLIYDVKFCSCKISFDKTVLVVRRVLKLPFSSILEETFLVDIGE